MSQHFKANTLGHAAGEILFQTTGQPVEIKLEFDAQQCTVTWIRLTMLIQAVAENTSLTCQEPSLRFFSRIVFYFHQSTFSLTSQNHPKYKRSSAVAALKTLNLCLFTSGSLLRNSESCHVGSAESASKHVCHWLEGHFLRRSQSQVRYSDGLRIRWSEKPMTSLPKVFALLEETTNCQSK